MERLKNYESQLGIEKLSDDGIVIRRLLQIHKCVREILFQLELIYMRNGISIYL